MKTSFALLATAALFVSPSVHAEEGKALTIKLGDVEVKIPIPAGFHRLDGVDADFDRIQESFLPPTNKQKLNLGSAEDRAAIASGEQALMARTLNIQVMRELESKNISKGDFKELRNLTRKQLTEMDLNTEMKNISKELSNTVGEDVEVDIKTVGGIGVLEEDPNHITFGTVISLGFSGPDEKIEEKGYAVGSLIRLHGKVINLYSNVGSVSAEDKAWARDTMKNWRSSILGANFELANTMADVPESNLGRKKPFSGILRAAVIGAVIGGVIALFGRLKKKNA